MATFKIQHRGQGTGTGKLGAIGTLVVTWTERYATGLADALYSAQVSSMPPCQKTYYTVRVDEPDPKLGNMVLEQSPRKWQARGRDAVLDPGP